MKKIVLILGVLAQLLYGGSNLEYFKKYIDFNNIGSRAPALHDDLTYNVGGVYISSSIEDEYCKYEYSLIPYFQIKSFKNPHFITNANTHKFGVKQGFKIGDFPRMEVIIYNTQEGDDYCQSIANKLRKNPHIRFTAQETASTKDKLKDRRFDHTNERNTIKVGSLIEKVLVKTFKQKSIFFLKKYNNYDMTIKIEDLCYGNNKINSCDDDTLVLKTRNGKLVGYDTFTGQIKENVMEQEPSEQEPSEQEPSEQEPSEQEPSEQEPSEQEPSEQEPSEQEPSEQEPSEQEPSEQEPSEQEPSEQEPSEQEPSEQEPSEEPENKMKHYKLKGNPEFIEQFQTKIQKMIIDSNSGKTKLQGDILEVSLGSVQGLEKRLSSIFNEDSLDITIEDNTIIIRKIYMVPEYKLADGYIFNEIYTVNGQDFLTDKELISCKVKKPKGTACEIENNEIIFYHEYNDKFSNKDVSQFYINKYDNLSRGKNKEVLLKLGAELPTEPLDIEGIRYKIIESNRDLQSSELKKYFINTNDRKVLGSRKILIHGMNINNLYLEPSQSTECNINQPNMKCKIDDDKIKLYQKYTTNDLDLLKSYLSISSIDILGANKHTKSLYIRLSHQSSITGSKQYRIEVVNGNHLKISLKKCTKNKSIEFTNSKALDVFKYTDHKYYLLTFKDKDLCEAKESKNANKISFALVDDLNDYKICKTHLWIRAFKTTKCYQGQPTDSGIKFDVKIPEPINKLIIIENNNIFKKFNKELKQIFKEKYTSRTKVIVLENDGSTIVDTEELKHLSYGFGNDTFLPFNYLSLIIQDVEDNKDIEEVIYFTAKIGLDKPRHGGYAFLSLKDKLTIYTISDNTKAWENYISKVHKIGGK